MKTITVEKTPVKKLEILQVVNDPIQVDMVNQTEILSAPLSVFDIPVNIQNSYQEKNLDSIIYTMSKYGQQQPVTVVNRNGVLFIVDGASRYVVAKKLGLPMLKYILIDIPDDQIIQQRLILNQRTKRSIVELCLEAEHILNVLGKSQGKKRELLGFDNMDSDDEFGIVGKDRFEFTCSLLGIKMKSSSLRKLMWVFWSEWSKPIEERTGVLELLSNGKLSIDKAHKLLNSNKLPSNKPSQNLSDTILGGLNENWYQLYNKSSMDMSEVPNETVRLCIDSHPYLWLRKYRNQDELCHGQEETVEEYVENFVKFCRQKREKLVKGGVLVTIIGETYHNGYKGVCTKVETALENDGWIILDVNIWAKLNGKYAPHPNRFLNSYERIIVACKPGAEPFFQEVMRKSSTEGFKVKPTSSGGHYLATPQSCITNVFTTSVHNTKELKVVDQDFQHDAPCPEKIYEIFIEAYSRPGETILDVELPPLV